MNNDDDPTNAFEHTRIRWAHDLSGTFLMLALVAGVAFLFGLDSPVWQRTLAIFLMISASHSLAIMTRGTALGYMPLHVKTWHQLHVFLGVFGTFWFYSVTSSWVSTFVLVPLWFILVGSLTKAEKTDRKERGLEGPKIIVEDWGKDT